MVSFPCLGFHKDVVYINLHAVVYHGKMAVMAL